MNARKPKTKNWLLSAGRRLENHHLPSGVWILRFVGPSTTCLFRDAGVTGVNLKKATKVSEEMEKGSFWLWFRREDNWWGQLTLTTAAGGHANQLQGWQGDVRATRLYPATALYPE